VETLFQNGYVHHSTVINAEPSQLISLKPAAGLNL